MSNKIQDKQSSVVVIHTTDIIMDQTKEIDDLAESFTSDQVRKMAENYAARGLPEKHVNSIEEYIDPIRAFFTRLLSDTALAIGSAVREKLGALDMHQLTEKTKRLKLALNANKTKVDELQKKRYANTTIRTLEEFKRLKLLLNVFTAIETIGYVMVFIAFGDNVMLACIFGLLFGLSQTIGIKSLVLWLRDGAGRQLNKWTKRAIWLGVAIVAGAFGMLRYWLAQSSGDEGGLSSSPLLAQLVFIIMSLFLIAMLALYVAHYYPTPEEELAMNKKRELEDEIVALQNIIERDEEAVKKIHEDMLTLAHIHTLLLQADKDMFLRTNAHFLKAVGEFKYHNRISRTDNVSPDCFSETVQPLAIPNYSEWNQLAANTTNA